CRRIERVHAASLRLAVAEVTATAAIARGGRLRTGPTRSLTSRSVPSALLLRFREQQLLAAGRLVLELAGPRHELDHPVDGGHFGGELVLGLVEQLQHFLD